MLDYNYINNLANRDTDINEHLLGMYGIVVGMNAKVVVELGAGQSTFALTAAVNETKGHLWSVDLSGNSYLRLFPEGEGMFKNEERITFIVGDDMEIIKGWDRVIDFLLIDTSHTYEHTIRELKTWPDKVRKGGVIAMHDSGYTEDCGVRRAIDEFIKEKKWQVLHLQDTKHLGLSYICKP